MEVSQQDRLRRLLDSPNRHEQAEAAIVLADANDTSVLGKMRELAKSEDDLVALAGMYACLTLGAEVFSAERFGAALISDDEELVQLAVHMACGIGSPMVARLTPLLYRSPELTIAVLELLGDIGGAEALDAIRSIDSQDRHITELVRELLLDLSDNVTTN